MQYKHMAFVASQIDALVYGLNKAHCEFRVMDKTYLQQLEFPEIAVDSSGTPLFAGDAYMVITCANGYKYYINVTADSPYAACADTFRFIQHKL